MGYDRGDRFPFDFEPNGIPIDSKSKGKLAPQPYTIQFERKWNTFFSVYVYKKKNIHKDLTCIHTHNLGLVCIHVDNLGILGI